ncbi:heavy metal response regulator [compost metagenome]
MDGAEVWQLDRTNFRMQAPGGGHVLLTRRESQLLERLVREPGSIVTRAEILSLLGYDAGDPGSRALDAAISRLRAKVHAECGGALPLQTVQGAGFVFSGQVRLA